MAGTPVCLLGLLGEPAEVSDAAETQPGAADPAALDFWTRGMGLSVSAIPSAGPATRSAVKNAGVGSGFAREPIFLHYDDNEKALITVDQIDRRRRLPGGVRVRTPMLPETLLNAALLARKDELEQAIDQLHEKAGHGRGRLRQLTQLLLDWRRRRRRSTPAES